jgi:hypothetical protein
MSSGPQRTEMAGCDGLTWYFNREGIFLLQVRRETDKE